MKKISVANYSKYPGLRHEKISSKSGEGFYHTVLNQAFKEALDSNEVLEVDLDQTSGYAPSFVDEAFGNLVYDFGEEKVIKYLKIISNKASHLIPYLHQTTFPKWQKRRENQDQPIITAVHPDWWHFNGTDFEKINY